MTRAPERKHKTYDGFSVEAPGARYLGVVGMMVPFTHDHSATSRIISSSSGQAQWKTREPKTGRDETVLSPKTSRSSPNTPSCHDCVTSCPVSAEALCAQLPIESVFRS